MTFVARSLGYAACLWSQELRRLWPAPWLAAPTQFLSSTRSFRSSLLSDSTTPQIAREGNDLALVSSLGLRAVLAKHEPRALHDSVDPLVVDARAVRLAVESSSHAPVSVRRSFIDDDARSGENIVVTLRIVGATRSGLMARRGRQVRTRYAEGLCHPFH